jgi:MoxR-like ATPase
VSFASPELLAAAAADLAGSHALTIVTIPAMAHALRNGEGVGQGERDSYPMVVGFGTQQERWALERFELREGPQPYLGVWASPPAFVNRDYAGSTLQRQRTREALGQGVFHVLKEPGKSKSTGTSLRRDAVEALQRAEVKPVRKFSLAVWLARHESVQELTDYLAWFDRNVPVDELGLGAFYLDGLPAYATNWGAMESPLWPDDAPRAADILEAIGSVAPPASRAVVSSVPEVIEGLQTPSFSDHRSSAEVAEDGTEPLEWTRKLSEESLRDVNVAQITQSVLDALALRNVVLPDAENLVRRCVTALLVGHLVLQGPPGTGKTTLARALAAAFDVTLHDSTATSEWSPYQVVGGLRPSADGNLQAAYGHVTSAALACAQIVRAEIEGDAEEDSPQAVWLLIDEFNRADIDKAIGSLYTVLSSVSAENLTKSPIDLWFEQSGRQLLWVPGRFRIVAAMNDLDTSFVNVISQGLTRRFQFITVGVPEATEIADEVDRAFSTAHTWVQDTYAASFAVPSRAELAIAMEAPLALLRALIPPLRQPSSEIAGWPVGTAQVVDLLRVTAVQTLANADAATALDWAITDRLVPQMALLDEPQLSNAEGLFAELALPNAAAAVRRLKDPYAT